MPSGIVLTSASPGASEEAIKEVFEKNGLEVDAPPAEPEPEPQRDAFESDEEYDAAIEAWQEKQKESEGRTDAEGDEEQASTSKPRISKFQKRVNKITARIQEENAELKRRLEALEKGGKTAETKELPKEENPRPARKDFKTDEEYEDALISWGTDKKLADRLAKEATEAQQKRLQENLESYKSQVEEFKSEHDDWDETVSQDIPMYPQVQLAIMEEREVAAEAIYYLGKHPDYTKKLAEMPPLSAVMEVGRLCARLKSGSPGSSAGDGAANKPRPRVPAPIRPVSTAATSSSLSSKDAAQKRDFKAFKQAQRAGR